MALSTLPQPPIWPLARKLRSTPDQLRTALTPESLPVDVEALAVALGVYVYRIPQLQTTNVASSITTTNHKNLLVVTKTTINHVAAIWLRDESPSRLQRFAIAWSIAHILLHPEGTYSATASTFNATPTDQEAVNFAFDLLVPTKDLQTLNTNDLDLLVQTFDVPAALFQTHLFL